MATFNWTNTGSANWGQANGWNTGTVANGAANNAFINVGNVFVENTNANIGNLNVNGGNLFVDNAGQNLTVNNALVLNAGNITLNANTSLNVGTTFTENGGAYTQ